MSKLHHSKARNLVSRGCVRWLLVVHELSVDSLIWAKLGFVGVTAMVRIGMHSIWKKDE